MNSTAVIIGIIIIAAIAGAFAFSSFRNSQVLCTADVKECEDGSFVSRNSDNNCEFYECPSNESNLKDNSIGNIDIEEETVSQGVIHTIEITSSGFSPNSLEIESGDSVKFVNLKSVESWPASDIHPTHTLYPGSGSSKCGTAEEENIFDACRGLQTGESYTFTFNEKGSWGYHDHLRASSKGTIIVN